LSIKDQTKISLGMQVKSFGGTLQHKNPICDECGSHCFSLYSGGKKERVTELYVCRNCKIIFTLPIEKKCEFTKEIQND